MIEVDLPKTGKHESYWRNEDEDEDDCYDYPDWVDGDNHYFHISESEIEIESKSTGDVVSLSLKDMGELYLLIRERLLENEEI